MADISMIPSLENRYRSVIEAVEEACRQAGRPRDEVTLLAVSKTVPVGPVRELLAAGQLHFAESRVQEAQPKINQLPDSITWHFIGNIQRNKLRKILGLFPVIHSLSSWELATSMDRMAGEMGLVPKVFLQVNLSREASKGGFEMETLMAGFPDLLALGNLSPVGLMCIPPPSADPGFSRTHFRGLRELRDDLQQRYDVSLPFLSMGMSHDFPEAIEEGATHVRVGSAIFGERHDPGRAPV